MSSLLGAAAINAGAGLLGSFFGSSKQDKNAQAQRDWQEKMYLIDRDYNTAVNQRKRWEQAGLNPNLMMNGSAGSVSGNIPSTSMSNSGETLASGISQSVGTLGQAIAQQMDINAQQALRASTAKQAEADADKASAEEEAVRQENMWRINQLMAKTSNLHLKNEFQSLLNEYSKRSLDERVDNVFWDNEEKKANIEVAAKNALLLDTQNEIQKINLAWLPVEKQVGLANVISNTAMQTAQAGLNRAAAKAQIALAYLNYMQANGVKIDNKYRDQANKLANKLTANMVNSAYYKQLFDQQSYGDSQTLPNKVQRYFGVYQTGTLPAAGGFVLGKGAKQVKKVVNKPKPIGFRK